MMEEFKKELEASGLLNEMITTIKATKDIFSDECGYELDEVDKGAIEMFLQIALQRDESLEDLFLQEAHIDAKDNLVEYIETRYYDWIKRYEDFKKKGIV